MAGVSVVEVPIMGYLVQDDLQGSESLNFGRLSVDFQGLF